MHIQAFRGENEKHPYTLRLPPREQLCVSWMAPSMTAVRCLETLTTRRPEGSSEARRWTLHPEPTDIVGVQAQPTESK